MNGATIEIGTNLYALCALILASLGSIAAAIASIVAAVRARELKPNGGSSIKDQVNKLHRVVVSTDRVDDATEPTVTIEKKGT